LLLLLVFAGPGVAMANDEITKQNYPTPVLARPIVLPLGMIESELMFMLSSTGGQTVLGADIPGGAGEALTVGVDVGAFARAQVGIHAAFGLNPNASFDAFLVRFDYTILDQMAARVLVLVDRAPLSETAFGATMSTTTNSVSIGLGLPIKWRLGPRLALTSDRIGGYPALLAQQVLGNSTARVSGLSTLSNELFTIRLADKEQSFTLNVPIGLLVQVCDWFAVQPRVGLVIDYDSAPDGNTTTKAVPLGADLIATLAPAVDVGFSFELLGLIDSVADYDSVRSFNFWVRGRL
jgi:hypothetical protein